jgi:hypothetical protein
MIILCYLSWSVDFSTNNDDDKDGADDDDNNDDVSTVFATSLLHHRYLSTHLSSTLMFDDFFAFLIWVNCCIS